MTSTNGHSTKGFYAEQLLPHDIEAEEALIGAFLIDGDSYSRVAGILEPEDFYRERNRHCFQACGNVFQRGQAVDQVTIASELNRSGHLDDVGGMSYLSHLVSITPTSAHVPHYAQLVADAAVKRRLISAACRIAALGYEAGDVDGAMREAEDLLLGVWRGQAQGGFVSLKQGIDEFLAEWADLASEPDLSKAPILTGLADLDEIMGGMRRTDLIIVGARPGTGKTALAMTAALSAAKDGQKVGFCSLEMSRQQMVHRILAAESGVDMTRLRLGLYTDREEGRIVEAAGTLSELPLWIDETWFQRVQDIRSKARRLAIEHGLDLLVVDYLQLVQGSRRGRGPENRTVEVSEISRSLKALAGELRIPIIACSQLSRQVESRQGHRPQLSDLRDSGSIEQDADTVMFIHREDAYYTEDEWNQHHPGNPYPLGIAEIILAKQRNGPTGSIRLRFRDSLVRFESLVGR